mgnify:CR=1 FL=1
MRLTAPLRRATAALATASLALASLATGLVAPASAATALVVDDFAGTSIGTRELLAPGEWDCQPTRNTTLTPGAGTLKVDVRVPDSLGCTFGEARLRWTASGTVDITAGGADRIELRYRDVTPNQPSAVSFGLDVTDVNGRVAYVGGLSRNGGAASDWLTVRYTPAYQGDVAVLTFPAGFDRTRVTSITLRISATAANQNVSVTLEQVGTGTDEPTYQAPAFASTDPLVFPPSTSTTRTVTVTGNPAPDVSVLSGKPAWMTVSTSKAGSTTTVTMSGNPGTSYQATPVRLHADVAGSLTADADIPVVVPSPVSVSSWGADARLGAVTSETIGTASSTPASSILGPTTGLPPGTSLSMSGSDVRLTGTPTATGTYTVATTVGNAYRTAPFSAQVVVGAKPTFEPLDDVWLVHGEPFEIPITTTGYPAPNVTFLSRPVWASYADGALSGTAPTTDSAVSVTVLANNGWGSAVATFWINVGPRPTVTAPSTTVVTAGELTAIPLTAAGATSASATGLPAGLSVVSSDGTWTITGTPTRPTSVAGTSGTATITATSAFGTATATWAWTVQAAPLLTGPAAVSTTVGTALSGATITSTGYPAPTLAAEVLDDGALPTGLSFDTSTPGTIAVVGTPTASGTVVVRVTADNGVGPAVVRDVTVSALTGPSFAQASPDLTVAAGSSDTLTLVWSGHERPTLTLGSSLPSWLSFDAASGTFTAEPTAGVEGVFGPYAVTATNATGTAVANVTVTVTAPPAVELYVGGITAGVGYDLGTWTIARYTGYPVPTVEVTDLPPGVVATAADGEIALTGTATATGTYTATFVATNAHGTDVEELRVEITSPPTLSAPTTLAIPVGVETTLPITVGGYPRPTLEATGLPAGLVLDGAAGTVSGTPTTPGRYTVELAVTYDGSPTDADPVTMTLDVTAAPTFATTPVTTTLRRGTAADVAAFTVAGHPTPTATAVGLPAGLSLAQDGAAVRLVGTPSQTGTFDVEVELTSTVGTDSLDWTVVVQEPASISVPATVTVDANEEITPVVVTTSGYPAPAVTAIGLPDGLEVVTDGSGTRIIGTPTQDGAHAVVLTAINGVGMAAISSLLIHVRSLPDLGDDRTLTFPADEETSHPLGVTGYPTPTLTVSGLPSWLVLDPTTGVLTGTPTDADQGADTVLEVTATNAAGTDTVEITVVVTAAPSTADDDGTTTVRAGTPVDEALTTVAGYPTPAPTTTGLPDGLDVTLVGDELRLVGSTTEAGTHEIEVTLANGSGPDLVVPWTVVVEEPAALTGTDAVRVTLGDAVDETFTATGYPLPSVTATGLPAGLAWVPAVGGGRLVGTPQEPGTSTVVVTAHNGVDADATLEVTLTVGLRPVVVTLSADAVRAGEDLRVTAGGLQDGEQVEVWLHSTPQLLATATADADGELDLTVTIPAGTPVGSHTVVVEAASGATGTAPVEVLAAASPTPTPTADPEPTTAPSTGPTPSPSPTRGTGSGSDDLATTGGDAAVVLTTGVLALLAGAALLLVRRRRA